MNDILLDLSGKIDAAHVAALSLLKQVADSAHIPFFVVGATARDYILEFGHGSTSYRMTRDIDIGVKVADWGQYETLASALVATGKFIATRNKHRFLFGEVIVNCWGQVYNVRLSIISLSIYSITSSSRKK